MTTDFCKIICFYKYIFNFQRITLMVRFRTIKKDLMFTSHAWSHPESMKHVMLSVKHEAFSDQTGHTIYMSPNLAKRRGKMAPQFF
jgi:hypothetical protein